MTRPNRDVTAGHPAPRGRVAWQFRPRAHYSRAERVDRFVDRLTIALEAGHALPGEVRFLFHSGPRGMIVVETPFGGPERWWAGAIGSLFAPGQWAPQTAPPCGGVQNPTWVGRPLRPFPSALWRAGPTTLAHRIGLALRALPPGLVLGWELRPSGVHAPAVEVEAPVAYRRGPGTPMGSSPSRTPPPQASAWERTSGLAQRIWAARATLSRAGGELRVSEDERRTVEGTLRGVDGNGIGFHRARSWPFGSSAEFPIRGTDLLSLFPGPAGEGWPELESSAVDDAALAVGVDDRGASWGLPLPLREGRHLAALGETGMGKSSFLVSAALAASDQHGVVLFDPMGEAARELRDSLAPAARQRLVWLSPAESAHGLNALAVATARQASSGEERRISDLVEALRRVRAGHYAERSFWGPRIEEMLARALRAAISVGGTLVDAHRFLDTAVEGNRPPGGAPAEVFSLFERVRQRPEDAEGARRLLFEFASSPDLVRLLCDRSSELRRADLVRPSSITILSGDASRVGEGTTRRLMATFLAIVWGEILARPHPSKTFVVLDEVQWFGHETLGEMLRLARRFNVHVLLGTQSLSALPPELADAVRTNVADFLLFRGSPEEAREFGRSIPALHAEDVLALGRGEAILLEGKGQHVRFIRVRRPRLPRNALTTPPVTPERNFEELQPRRSAQPPEVGRETRAEGGLARVYISELSTRTAAGSPTVRELGGILGRQGAIRGKGSDARGLYWELTADGLAWLRTHSSLRPA